MENHDETVRLLAIARKDLRALTGMKDGNVFAEEIFGFHAQQVVEKALKAWLALIGQEYPWSHDISLLLSKLAEEGIPTQEDTDLIEYTPYAVQFRYEAFDELGERLNRPAVIQRLTELIEKISSLIEESKEIPSIEESSSSLP